MGGGGGGGGGGPRQRSTSPTSPSVTVLVVERLLCSQSHLMRNISPAIISSSQPNSCPANLRTPFEVGL